MFVFYKEDVSAYFACDYDLRNTGELSTQHDLSLEDHSKLEVCEVRLAVEFLKSMGEQLSYTLDDSRHKIASRFIIVDHEMIEQYWCKYNSSLDKYLHFGKYEQMSFLDWLNYFNDHKV